MKNKGVIIFVVALILLVFIAVITNPGEEKHRNALNTELKGYISNLSTENFGISNEVLDNMMLNVIDNMIVVRNRWVFSTTAIVWKGETYTVGFGAFGHVFISEKIASILNNGKLIDKITI